MLHAVVQAQPVYLLSYLRSSPARPALERWRVSSGVRATAVRAVVISLLLQLALPGAASWAASHSKPGETTAWECERLLFLIW